MVICVIFFNYYIETGFKILTIEAIFQEATPVFYYSRKILTCLHTPYQKHIFNIKLCITLNVYQYTTYITTLRECGEQ